jgi:hypothetical protein
MLLDMAGSQQALKAKKHFKNPNEINTTTLHFFEFSYHFV